MHQTPSTPQHIYPSQSRSSFSSIATPMLSNHRSRPLTPNIPVQQITTGNPSFAALPSPLNVPGADLLDAHRPMPTTPESAPIISALIAHHAVTANQCRAQRDRSNTHTIDWRWYVKEVTRRKFIYLQITEVLGALCSLLELTTDATAVLYCSRTERRPDNYTMGRGEFIYGNHRGAASQAGSPLFNNVINAARVFGDHLSLDWRTRQNMHDSAALNGTLHSLYVNQRVHHFGDFPALCRFDSNMVDDLVDEICTFDWSSIGFDVPQRVAALAPTSTAPPPEQGPSTGSFGQTGSNLRISSVSLEDDTFEYASTADNDKGDDFASSAGPTGSSFIGRRATNAELRHMDRLGLSELQKVQVRLVLWEIHPDDWYDGFRSIFHNNNQATYRLLGLFGSTLA